MENPEQIESSEQMPLPEDFQNANAIIDSISQSKDSQPTKLRVKNFKNRVFHLIKIFTTHSANINPLVQCLKQEMFLREPEKMRELVHQVLNKQNIDLENLQQLLQYHKVILLYKNDKVKGDGISVDFIKILKKISLVNPNIVHETVLQLLKSFAFVRKSKLNINFFFYFFRNYEGASEIKKSLLQKCEEYINDPKLRNAQKKQLTKLRNKLDKTSKPKAIKKEEIQSQDDDEIKVVGKNKTAFNALKVEKKEQKHQNDKIQVQGEVQKPKKQLTTEMKEKLQRIKENKKKNRKQNKNKQKNESQNTNPKIEHKNGHSKSEQNNNHQKPEHKNVNGQQKKNSNQGNNQRTPSKGKQNFSKQKVKGNKFQKQ